MTHIKANKSKILALILGLSMSLVLMLGMVFSSPTFAAYAEGGTQIDTLGVAFKKVNVGDSLANAFEFEDETERTLKVPVGANYTATLEFVSKNGQAITLWEKDNASFSWSRVENQLIEQKVGYCIRVFFEPKENYKLSKEADVLKRNMKVLGAELGKGKDIELWDSAGQNTITTAIKMDFIISRGMTYIGYPRYISPRINETISGKIGTDFTDTGIWISGAPTPYTYEAKIAPIGMEIQTVNVFGKSDCYYQIIAKNAMDGGTMYITATAADGQMCDIPVKIAAVSGGHEHTWVEKIEKIDFEHHGYTKCTDPDCPGVAPAFDKGSQYASHEFDGGCTAACTKCGDLGNPDAKHNFTAVASDDDATFHVFKCVCGEFEKDANGNIKKEEHSGGTQTCLSGAQCDVCGKEYLAATGHKYEFKSFGNGDGTYTHLGFCKYCKEEDTNLRHSPTGGTATCQKKAKCDYEKNGATCGLEHGDFIPHNFVNGTCTKCLSDKYIKEVLIDVPEFYKGMAYEAMFYPTVIKGNVIDLGINYHIASFSRDGNGYLSGPHNFKTTFITENSVMQYAFKPQTNCAFPENIDDLNVKVTRGEMLSKKIRDNSGNLVVLVLLCVESVVQSIDIEISQPLAGLLPETITVTEKNGLEVTVNNVSGFLYDGVMTLNQSMQVEVTIKAPKGKIFQTLGKTSIENWLCKLNIDGGNLSSYTQSTDLKEITFVFQTKPAIECPHEKITLKEEGKLETCTEDGIKDKYVCENCGAAFFDAARTMEWNATSAVIPKGHLSIRHDATPCSEGKDGNIVYFECQRDECGKFFEDAACSKEITLEQTIIHDFKDKWSSNKDKHYHECKNCAEIKDEATHRPDKTAATEDEPVKCLDCEYIITPVLGHIHKTTLVDGVDSTCMKEGLKPYYKCSGCEVKFEDKEATKPITDESSLVIAKAHKFGAWVDEVPATEEKEGVKAHKDCEFCNKHFNENGLEIIDLTIAKLVKVEVTVVGGTGGGRFTVGDTITVTAEDKEGKVFKCWKDSTGEIVRTEKSYTFTVTGETTLTAVYEDAPVAKKGLSGGAIAGITIGSVAVSGIGGFAIFWFVVKKKTFAELIAAIKAIFTKKK